VYLAYLEDMFLSNGLLTFSARGRYFEKNEMPTHWTGLTIIIIWVDDGLL
jgi:hypothetical protein